MFKKLLFLLPVLIPSVVFAQQDTVPAGSYRFKDSVVVQAHAVYNEVNGFHRWLFGENYRKDWGMPVKLPVIKLSEVYGGLTPIKQGGGMQSKSLRLKDRNGKEYVLRSVEKSPEKLLPPALLGTFTVDWVDDEFSGQHPYSALVVPPLATAAGVPHATPVIGVVAGEDALGEYKKKFTNLLCLLEEREPAGESDNTIKMEKELVESYKHRFDGDEFLKARMLDLLMADWDRHEDQWRWAYDKDGKEKMYIAVPRDRDQVFHITQGVFPTIAALPWLDPTLENFDGPIPRVRYSLYKTRFIKAFPDAQMSYDHWMKITREFVAAETDSVFEVALRRLPREIYALRHDELIGKLKARRANIPQAMKEYYYFVNKIVDLRASDKDELVTINDATGNGLNVVFQKLGKDSTGKDTIMNMTYRPDATKEIRLYLSAGDDHVIVDNKNSAIKLRVIDSAGHKTYDIRQPGRKITVYGRPDSASFSGNAGRIRKRFNNDSLTTRFVATDLYNVWMPLATAGINADDGLLIGAGFKYTHQEGFKKSPYTSVQQLMVTHSFETDAFRIRYNGEWVQAVGKADFMLQANIHAPDNTMNFFGLGNESVLVKQHGYRKFYRARFDVYQLDPSLRWRTGKGSFFSIGPSLQFYHINPEENEGRFILNTSQLNLPDSATLTKDKLHVGAIANFVSDGRDNHILPKNGYYFDVEVQGYTGLNSYSKSFFQIRPEFTYYQKLNAHGTFVLFDRVGGGVSLGKPAFYQSMFLGGQGNLLGYLQNRFAGQHMFYNNLQARLKLANIASYILPGQLGLTGFYDAGRVWINGEHSDEWHQGVGGGFYFAPAGLTVLQVMAGHSSDGWYPYIALNFRI